MDSNTTNIEHSCNNKTTGIFGALGSIKRRNSREKLKNSLKQLEKLRKRKQLLLLSKLRKFGRTTIWRFDHAFHACSKHLLFQNFSMVGCYFYFDRIHGSSFRVTRFYDKISGQVPRNFKLLRSFRFGLYHRKLDIYGVSI